MPTTQVILNGDFSNSTNNSAASWTGNDIETRGSDVYISGTGAAQGRVVEMNGGAGQTTVLQQSFTLTDEHSGDLSFDFALRSGASANVDGFRVEVLDDTGAVIYSSNVFPTQAVYQTFTASVDFPSAGEYTLRFTELDNGADGRGALLDNVSLIVCFAGETQIATPEGGIPARNLAVGDLVKTANGPKPIRWIARRHVRSDEMAEDSRYAPVSIKKGALGGGLPENDLKVSRQHRLLVRSKIAEKMFGISEVLLPAVRLAGLPGICIQETPHAIEYVHILLDEHEVLYAEGAPAESMLLGDKALASLTPASIEEIKLIFPGALEASPRILPARPIPERLRQKKLVERIKKNNRAVLESYLAS